MCIREIRRVLCDSELHIVKHLIAVRVIFSTKHAGFSSALIKGIVASYQKIER